MKRAITKRLRNFTGVVRRNPDGTLVIVGTGPKPKGAKALNPMSKGGRFAKCVKAVQAKGGAYDLRAVCGAMEKRAKRNPIEYRFVNEGGGRGYFVSTRKRPGKGRVVSLPRGYVKDSDGVYRKPKRKRGKTSNPRGGVKTFHVTIPATRYDRGYSLAIKAKTKASARAEAKRYCSKQWAKYTGRPESQYKLPAKTKVTEI